MNAILRKNSTSFKILLLIAGAYHLLWGFAVIVFPSFFFNIANLPQPTYTELWQMTGVYAIIFAIAYFIAASNPIRHWRIVLLGFLSKVIVLLAYALSFITGRQDSVLFNMILVNHVIWMFPFGMILYNAYQQQFVLDNELIRMSNSSMGELLEAIETNKHHTVKELADKQKVMLVFLRHFGCVFCRETLLSIQKHRAQIENEGVKIVLVNMIHDKHWKAELAKFNLQDIEYISDTESLLYKAFKLRRGTFTQLFGLKTFFKGIPLWFKPGALTKYESADVYQMPGIFLIYKGAVVKKFIHESVSDTPPYLELATFNPRR